jgi:hypothetical protein
MWRGNFAWHETDDGIQVNHGAGPDWYSRCKNVTQFDIVGD